MNIEVEVQSDVDGSVPSTLVSHAAFGTILSSDLDESMDSESDCGNDININAVENEEELELWESRLDEAIALSKVDEQYQDWKTL
jgi:hypothetical protein